jgi:ubiquinone/menaquinone biosynthesis C-methylase UbiE
MSQFWNERYAVEEYVYGTKPNRFYCEQLEKLPPGKILFPAEGEGRNAVHAATKQWQVTAFDTSIEAKKKAEKLATKNNINLIYHHSDYETIKLEKESFDCVVLIYAHIQPEKRKAYHQKMASFLKPGGTLILEAFSKNQIKYNTGGPKNMEMLYSNKELHNDFSFFSELSVYETEIELDEGPFHNGSASVVRVRGTK